MGDARDGVSFLMLAAGGGERLGLGPKGLLELQGRPLLCWLADKALQVTEDVLVAVPVDRVEATAALLPQCRVVAGGGTRQDSIAVLAGQARGQWLLVHEAARPFASLALFRQVIAIARHRGCAGAFLSPVVPVARLRDGRVVEAYAGSDVGIFQTPQVYARADLQRMLRHRATVPGWFAQSPVQLALAAGIYMHAVPGEASNLKITTAEDWPGRATSGTSAGLSRTPCPPWVGGCVCRVPAADAAQARWTMPKSITGAVGRGGRNFPPVDVMTVQYLLNCVPAGQGGPSPELAVDGVSGPRTIAAIEKYQRSLGLAPDGRVDPGGNTLRTLQARDPYPQQGLPSSGAKGGLPAGKGDPLGKGGGNQQAGAWPGGKGGDPYGKGGGGNQGGYPPGGKGGGGGAPGKTSAPFGGGGGMLFPGGKGGGGKGF